MEGSLRRSLFVAKTFLTQWRGSLSRMWYYTMEGSNGEDNINTEDGIQKDCFDTEGGGGEDGSEGSTTHLP